MELVAQLGDVSIASFAGLALVAAAGLAPAIDWLRLR